MKKKDKKMKATFEGDIVGLLNGLSEKSGLPVEDVITSCVLASVARAQGRVQATGDKDYGFIPELMLKNSSGQKLSGTALFEAMMILAETEYRQLGLADDRILANLRPAGEA